MNENDDGFITDLIEEMLAAARRKDLNLCQQLSEELYNTLDVIIREKEAVDNEIEVEAEEVEI